MLVAWRGQGGLLVRTGSSCDNKCCLIVLPLSLSLSLSLRRDAAPSQAINLDVVVTGREERRDDAQLLFIASIDFFTSILHMLNL